MKSVLPGFVIFLFSACSHESSNFKIVPLHPYFKFNKYDSIIQRYEYYLVEGFDESEEQFNKIQEYCFARKDTGYASYDGYQVVFYKETRRTNQNYREKESDMIAWHGKDIIFTFGWTKGKYDGHAAYRNGKILNPETKVTDIKE